MESTKQSRPVRNSRPTKLDGSSTTENENRIGTAEALSETIPLLAMLAAADSFEARQLSDTNIRQLAGVIGNQEMLAALDRSASDAGQIKACAARLAAPLPEFADGAPKNELLPANALSPAEIPAFSESTGEAVGIHAVLQLTADY